MPFLPIYNTLFPLFFPGLSRDIVYNPEGFRPSEIVDIFLKKKKKQPSIAFISKGKATKLKNQTVSIEVETENDA